MSPRVTNLALQYLGHAIKTAATWKLLKPHTPGLVATVLLPLMCYDDEDAELWRDDPHEYIRKVRPASRRACTPASPRNLRDFAREERSDGEVRYALLHALAAVH